MGVLKMLSSMSAVSLPEKIETIVIKFNIFNRDNGFLIVLLHYFKKYEKVESRREKPFIDIFAWQ